MISKFKKPISNNLEVILYFNRALSLSASRNGLTAKHVHVLIIANIIQKKENRFFTIADIVEFFDSGYLNVSNFYIKVLVNEGLIECTNEKRFYKARKLFNVTEKGLNVCTGFSVILQRLIKEGQKPFAARNAKNPKNAKYLNKARHKDPTPFKPGKR